MKRWIAIASIVVVAAAALFFVRQGKLRAEQAPQTVTLKRGSVAQEALAIGNIVPEQEVSVKSKIPGIVADVHVAIGDRVRRGDPLIDIRPDPTPLERTEAQRALEMARVAEDAAKKDLDRAQGLADQGLLPQKGLDDAHKAYDSSHLQAQLEKERLDLLKEGRAQLEGSEVSNRIVSPVDGTILTLEVHPGDPVVPLTTYQAGTVLITMADMSRLIFRGTVDEVDVGKLHVGQPIHFTVGAIPNGEVTGMLSRISPKARKQDSATLFDIEATITGAGDNVLRAGYSANAKISIARAESVLVLPERVVKYADGKATVRLQGKNGRPELREITTGLSDGLTVEVKDGLAQNDAVLEPEKSALAKEKQ
jgi:HlyD family secretion protein